MKCASILVAALVAVGCGQAVPTSPSESTGFRLSGIVREVAPSGRAVDAVRVEISGGPDAGAAALSDLTGFYIFPSLKMGRATVQVQKNGFLLWRITDLDVRQNTNLDIWLYPVPPLDFNGKSATARCRDSSWTWSVVRGEACAANGGVAYEVCPGPLCM
jgi:hypothetical protein